MDELVDDFVARRPAGLDAAYALWSGVLYSVASHVLGDRTAAEDCVHDALVRVWRSPNRFEGNRLMLRAYLIASVRNESIAMLRSTNRRDARELRAARLETETTLEVPLVDPVEAKRVRAALDRLPPEQRAALVCAYYENKTQAQIAEALDVPLGTVKSRIAMAMRKLHAELAVSQVRP